MAALLFISFIVLLLIGVPVAFAIAAAAFLVLLKGDVKLLILVQRMFASTDSFSLIERLLPTRRKQIDPKADRLVKHFDAKQPFPMPVTLSQPF